MKEKGKSQEAKSGIQDSESRIQKPRFKIQNLKSKVPNRAGLGFTFYLLPFAFLLLVGCGYRFAGTGGGFPRDVQTVYVEPFVNRSRIVGIEAEIASALRSELHRQGRLRVVHRLEEADAILSGVIRSLENQVVAANRVDEVLQYELALVMDATLRRRSPDEVLWRARGTRLAELYSASRAAVVTTSSDFKNRPLNARDVRRFTDVQLTESLKQEAQERLVERFVRELHQRLMEMF